MSIETLIAAARMHGEESEPDHEVGDLQELLRACWRVMSAEQRNKVVAAHREWMKQWLVPYP